MSLAHFSVVKNVSSLVDSDIFFPHARAQDGHRPEIMRSQPSMAILKLLSFGQTDVLGFRFVESPERDVLEAALRLLQDMGAVSAAPRGGLTDIGRVMSKVWHGSRHGTRARGQCLAFPSSFMSRYHATFACIHTLAFFSSCRLSTRSRTIRV
jgi:hypothetical protein